MILNETPIRTSENYGMNNINIEDFEIPRNIQDFDNLTITGDTDNFKISNTISKSNLKYGNGKELENLCLKKSNSNLKIEVQEKGFLNINFDLDEENVNLIENIEIDLNSKSDATIIINYKSKEDLTYFHNGIIKVNAKSTSNANIIIVNLLNNKSRNFLSMENVLEENASINYYFVDFGGKTSISNWYSNIKGNNAIANINTIYLGIKNQLFDINYISEIYGEKGQTNIEVQGALKDNAKKNFKGTIDFKKGCKKAKGNENEFCMLLSENTKSKALPMLLCTEEDIEGNHSTASGKINNQELFYIMSRGFSYNDAMKLLVKARFNSILNNIQDEKIKEEIINEIDSRLA